MSEPVFFAVQAVTLGQIAEKTGARLTDPGSAAIEISAAGPVEAAPERSLSFIDNPKYIKYLQETAALAVLCDESVAKRVPDRVKVLVHAEPYRAFATALAMLYPQAALPQPVTGRSGIDAGADIAADAKLESGVTVETGAVIGAGAQIGAASRILANAVVGAGVCIGRNCVVGAGATVQHALLGDRVILHPGVRVGQDGFGFAMGAGGHLKVPQIGRVIIQNDVEIGANSTVDRGMNRDTVIGEGTKIDNLVQIGHNVVIGRHCVIVGMAGIAGSATLGDYVVVAGQVGIVGHVTVGDGAQIGGGSGVNSDVKAGARVMGYPATDLRQWIKMNMRLKKLAASSDAGQSGESE